MMLLAVIAYFALGCLLAALLLLPSFRERLFALLAQGYRRLATAGASARQDAKRSTNLGIAKTSHRAVRGTRWLRSHWIGVCLAIGLLLIPPLVVFSLRGWHTLAAFDDTSVPGGSTVVSSLLQGEQLVPPPPLPPEIFATAEVESVRPQLRSADRRWDLMDEEFRQRLLLVYRLMREENGYDMVLLEGYRSPERQTMLAALGTQVTNAAAWQSYHQYGLAADSAFMRAGKLVISERDPWAMRGYELYGEIAQRVGLTWGGRWQNMDFGHVELRKPKPPRPKVGG